MEPRPYRFVIAGKVSDHAAFANLARRVEDGDTVLCGLIQDGDHLLAVLNALQSLDADLIGLQALAR